MLASTDVYYGGDPAMFLNDFELTLLSINILIVW